MTIVAPDPYPGRCKNHRTEFRSGQYVALRCLDYENTPHVCTFEELPPVPANASAWNNTYSMRGAKAKPWVKPGDPTPGEDD